MSARPAPAVDVETVHASFYAPDVRAAVAFYVEKLGFHQSFEWGEPPTIAGVNLGNTQMFLERGPSAPQGSAVYFVIGDVDELCAFHRAQGVEIVVEPGDREYGLRDYTVRDLHGYRLTFGHRVSFSGEPPLEIERVDLPVRLEKRLAAVLRDLAAYKRMSLSSCLEETLLHTFEPLGDGVASPHTARDLRKIQALKAEHGIDYDCHASYRFVERAAPADNAGSAGSGGVAT